MYLKKPDTAVLLLIGVKEEYQKKGVNSLIFNDMFQNFKDLGFKYAESSAELESNTKALQLWNGLEYEQHKRRRVYGKEI
jgi:GNAT superfamily N-acetyltransferase